MVIMRIIKQCITLGIVLISLIISSDFAISAILEVGPSGYEYNSIQSAIDNAGHGDKVLVHDGI
jgi:hypothetical protein